MLKRLTIVSREVRGQQKDEVTDDGGKEKAAKEQSPWINLQRRV